MGRHEGTNVFLGRGGAGSPHTRTPPSPLLGGYGGRASIGVWCRASLSPQTRKRSPRTRSQPGAPSPSDARPREGRTRHVSSLDSRGPDRCWMASSLPRPVRPRPEKPRDPPTHPARRRFCAVPQARQLRGRALPSPRASTTVLQPCRPSPGPRMDGPSRTSGRYSRRAAIRGERARVATPARPRADLPAPSRSDHARAPSHSGPSNTADKLRRRRAPKGAREAAASMPPLPRGRREAPSASSACSAASPVASQGRSCTKPTSAPPSQSSVAGNS
jgi:hypothetical protein